MLPTICPSYAYNTCLQDYTCTFQTQISDNLGLVMFIACIHECRYKYQTYAAKYISLNPVNLMKKCSNARYFWCISKIINLKLMVLSINIADLTINSIFFLIDISICAIAIIDICKMTTSAASNFFTIIHNTNCLS